MENPLKKNEFFSTPESTKELQAYCSSLSAEEERIAILIMSMTWNLASEIVEKEMEAA